MLKSWLHSSNYPLCEMFSFSKNGFRLAILLLGELCRGASAKVLHIFEIVPGI